MMVAAPLVGFLLMKVGRWLIIFIAMFVMLIGCATSALAHYVNSSTGFLLVFGGSRILQGLGSMSIQTANFSIIVKMFPNDISKAAGFIEMVAGIGLVLGPVIGSPLYKWGGFPTSFYFCCAYYVLTIPLLYLCVPSTVETEKQVERWKPSKVTYFSLITNRRIFVSSLACSMTLFQYTFIEPFLGLFVNRTFGVAEENVGYVFICLSGGFLIGC